MTTVVDLRQNSVDIDPNWYAGQPETADVAIPEAADAAQATSVPTVLTKLQKWGDYDSWGEPVWPSRFIPMKTPLSQDILDNWQLSNPPKHRLTVGDILAAEAAVGRHVGLILDLSNHDCLYSSDVPETVDYLHVQLVAKELPPLEFVQEVGRAANRYWSQHKDSYIAIHCAYGFNRTGFVVCSYLIEHCGLSVEQALQSFARARPPGVKHEKFRMELHARYGLLNVQIQRPISCCGPVCAVCGQASSSSSDAEAASTLRLSTEQQANAAECAGADSKHSSSVAAMDCYANTNGGSSNSLRSQQTTVVVTPQADDPRQQKPHVVPLRFNYNSSSQKPPMPGPLPPLAATNSSSIDGYTSQRVPDGTSSPLPLMSGRCYSSGSIGDNSSIGCSPDSTADFMLTGGSSTHSGSSHGYVAGRSPLSKQRQPQQQHSPTAGAQWPGRKPSLQQHSCPQQLQSSNEDCSPVESAVPLTVASAAGAGAAGHGLDSSCRDAIPVAADADVDAGVFEMDPCGDEQEDQLSGSQQGQKHGVSNSNGWRVVSPREQLWQQRAASTEQLSEMLAAVDLQQQQQQQADKQPNSSSSSKHQQQQQQTPGEAEPASISCDCSCHTAGAGLMPLPSSAGGGCSSDGGVWQQQMRYNSILGHGDHQHHEYASGKRPQELVENESFGRISSDDLLKSLRSLQQSHQSS